MKFQSDINMRYADGSPVPNLRGPGGAEDAEDSAQKAINYRTEPLWKRMGYASKTPFENTRNFDFTESFTNNSKSIGNNPLSEFKGVVYGIGPSSHYEVIPVNGAGGARRVAGDYLYRTQESFQFDGGIWGIFRVTP